MGQRSITNETLIQLMQQHKLGNVEVGRILGLKIYKDKRRPGTENCIRVARFRSDPGSAEYRDMEPNLLELLQLKLPAYLKERAEKSK